MDGATWWQANFYGYQADDFFDTDQTDVIDTHLLEQLFHRYGSATMSDLHYSVEKFTESRRQKTEPREPQEVTDYT
jgi:hypothetical protein